MRMDIWGTVEDAVLALVGAGIGVYAADRARSRATSLFYLLPTAYGAVFSLV